MVLPAVQRVSENQHRQTVPTTYRQTFPQGPPLRQVVNRNCVKISYGCTKNIKQIMQSHNRKILSDSQAPTLNTDSPRAHTDLIYIIDPV